MSAFPDHVSSVSPLKGRTFDGARELKPGRAASPAKQAHPVTVRRIHPSAKRLTATQSERGRKLYADGATERDVAKALGCSASTAHRLRIRLGFAESPLRGVPDVPPSKIETEAVPVAQPAPAAGVPSSSFTQLRKRHAELGEQVRRAELEQRRTELEMELAELAELRLAISMAIPEFVSPTQGMAANFMAKLDDRRAKIEITIKELPSPADPRRTP